MRHHTSSLGALLLGVVTLTGCGGGGSFTSTAPTATSTSIPTKTVPANGEHYSSVGSLKSAFIGAGGDCSVYEETNQVTLAAESATCGKSTVLSIYSSVADRDAAVDGLKQFADMIGMHLLVGENWIVNDKNVTQYQPKLGGTLVTRKATK